MGRRMKIIRQDITTVEAPAVIIHGVNCQGAMGSGVAKALYTKWPQVREAYMALPKASMNLGKVQPVLVGGDLYVLNCFTQSCYGYDGERYADLSAIGDCLGKTAKFCEVVGIRILYSPRLGCGL